MLPPLLVAARGTRRCGLRREQSPSQGRVITQGARLPRLSQRNCAPNASLALAVVEEGRRKECDRTHVFNGRAEYEFGPKIICFACSPTTNRNLGPDFLGSCRGYSQVSEVWVLLQNRAGRPGEGMNLAPIEEVPHMPPELSTAIVTRRKVDHELHAHPAIETFSSRRCLSSKA